MSRARTTRPLSAFRPGVWYQIDGDLNGLTYEEYDEHSDDC